MKKSIITVCILNVLLYAIIFIVGGLVVSLLWNELMPAIFGLITISWFQGIELSVLVYTLFCLPLNLVSGSNKK